MKREWELVDKPQLNIFLEYHYITVGDLGNMLIRFQACTRSLLGMGRKRRLNHLQGEPHFVAKSFYTKESAEFWIAVAAIGYSVVIQPLWQEFAKLAWRRLIATIYFAIEGELPRHESLDFLASETEVKLTKGTVEDLRIAVDLERLNEQQANKLADFVWSVIYPTNSAYIRDEETQLYISRRRRRPR